MASERASARGQERADVRVRPPVSRDGPPAPRQRATGTPSSSHGTRHDDQHQQTAPPSPATPEPSRDTRPLGRLGIVDGRVHGVHARRRDNARSRRPALARSPCGRALRLLLAESLPLKARSDRRGTHLRGTGHLRGVEIGAGCTRGSRHGTTSSRAAVGRLDRAVRRTTARAAAAPSGTLYRRTSDAIETRRGWTTQGSIGSPRPP